MASSNITLFIIFDLVLQIYGEFPILYVDSNGIDLNNLNCSKHSPCATLYRAVERRQNDPVISQYTDADIEIAGFNENDSNYALDFTITMNVSITFNIINETEMSNWVSSRISSSQWGIIKVDYDVTLTINNFMVTNKVIDGTAPGAIIYGPGASLIFFNCTIKNIMGNREELISGANIEIYDSVFSDIHQPMIYVVNGYVILRGNIINNFNLDEYTGDHGMIRGFDPHTISIQDCELNNISMDTLSGIIYTSCLSISLQVININNTSITGISGGSLLYLDDNILCSQYLSINNVHITTSNFIELGGGDSDLDKIDNDIALIMVPSTSELSIKNVNLTYVFADNINNFCPSKQTSNMGTLTYKTAKCNLPYRFIYNQGKVTMENVYITNDFNEDVFTQYRNTLAANNDTILGFYYPIFTEGWSKKKHFLSMIYNNNGELFVNDLVLYGVGIHQSVVYNSGVAIIEKFKILRPDYWYNSTSNIAIKTFMHTVIVHEGYYDSLEQHIYESKLDTTNECYFSNLHLDLTSGILIIKDSVLSGVYDTAIHITGGYVEIHDTSISYVPQAVHAYNSISTIIMSCDFKHIGSYYIGSYYIGERSGFQALYDELYFENVKYIVIDSNVFDYFARNLYLYIYNNDADIKTVIEITNNRFSNPITMNTFSIDQFGDVLKDWLLLEYSMENKEIDIDFVQTMYPDRNHLVNLEGYISSSFINNTFSTDEIGTALNMSCLYISSNDNDESTHCIAGNTFKGFAIKLKNAHLKSCAHLQLDTNQDTECWNQMGSFNTILNGFDHTDYFIATNIDNPLFSITEQSSIVLDTAIISTEFIGNDTNVLYNPFSMDETDGIIGLLDVIINEENHAIEIQFYEECINQCTELYQNSFNNIHQLHVNCVNISESSNATVISVRESKSFESINHTLPSQIYLNSSGSFYPGGNLHIDFVLLDIENNIIYNWNQDIFITLTAPEFNFETIMEIKALNDGYQCDICVTGLYIQNARIDEDLYQNYTIIAEVVDNLLFVNNISINVDKCPAGYGLDAVSSQCRECSIGEFSIESSTIPCYSCYQIDDLELYGVECIGNDKIVITKNYWIGIEYFPNKPIVSQHCPSNYCNQIDNGLYLNLSESNQLCSHNRDPNTALCGKCKEGYSELYGSSNCGECNRHQYQLWIIFASYSILLTLFIVFMNGIPINNSNTVSNFRRKIGINDTAKDFLAISVSKPILYYYQSVTFIFLNTGIFVQLSAFAEIFNFQLEFGENNGSKPSGYCWIPNLTAKYEIILRLIIPIICILTLVIMFVIYIAMRGYKLFGRNPYFAKSFVKILLLVIGSISAVCFKLIACKNIGGAQYFVHFYFGSEQCYGTTWFIAFATLCFFVTLFCVLFVKLWIDHNKNKKTKLLESREYILQSFVKSYNIDKYWYWEIIMFSRRLIIALMIMIGSDNQSSSTILFLLIIIYLILQIRCNPFKIHQINTLEIVCLLCLLFLLYIVGNNTNHDDILSIILLNALLVLPLILFIIQFIQISGAENENKNMEQENKTEIGNDANTDGNSDGNNNNETNIEMSGC